MALDFQALLYDPIYSVLGVSADLQPGSGEVETVGITVIDKTQGALVTESRIGVQSIKPAARVRAAEIISNGLTAANLAGGTIQFNSKTWRIESVQPQPSPKGEADGEILLVLTEEMP